VTPLSFLSFCRLCLSVLPTLASFLQTVYWSVVVQPSTDGFLLYRPFEGRTFLSCLVRLVDLCCCLFSCCPLVDLVVLSCCLCLHVFVVDLVVLSCCLHCCLVVVLSCCLVVAVGFVVVLLFSSSCLCR